MKRLLRDPDAARLDARILAWIESRPAGFVRSGATLRERYGLRPAEWTDLETEFDALALALFAYQEERVPVYRAFARERPSPRRALEVPALPVEAFKRARVAAFPPAHDRVVFHTSGTTAERPGVHALEDPVLYDAALERGFRHHVLPDRDRIRMLSLAAPAAAVPHSSLAYMLDRVQRRFGTNASRSYAHDGAIDGRALAAALRDAERGGEPVCVLGTAFAWVHVLERFAAESFAVLLPRGSRVFETGGYKGRSRELSRDELHAGFARHLGIPPTHVVGEYGMTELGSQYYTTALRSALVGDTGDTGWSHPAWLRPRWMDPATGALRELHAASGLGLLAHHDLANRGSVAHLLTADLAVAARGGFDLAGRAPHAALRGCGLRDELEATP